MKTRKALGASGTVIQMMAMVNIDRIMEIVFLINDIGPEGRV